MGEKYAECQKIHAHLGGKSDGCQDYEDGGWRLACAICGCHRSFHRKAESHVVKCKTEKVKSHVECKTTEEVAYTKCDKIHEFKYCVSVDGCQEFTPNVTADALTCAACGCHKNFHRKVEPVEVAYTKCDKIHVFKNQPSVDGCQKFAPSGKDGTKAALKCAHCGCHKGFHRKVEVGYKKCHKIHQFGIHISVDGCLEFTPSRKEGTEAALKCAVCGCHKSFHRNEISMEVTKTACGFR